MIPTLLAGDHIMVDKTRAPERGDLLVFPFPEHPNQTFIKRVIGMPGDHLFFRKGHPVINGREVPSCRVGRATYEDADLSRLHHAGDLYLEVIGDRRYLTFYDESLGFQEDQGPFDVREGEVFVVGDNRWNAHDSRMWFGGQGGGVPLTTVGGVPFVVWLAVRGDGIDWSRTGRDLRAVHLPLSATDLQPQLDECLARVGGAGL
jgi:signal peptidase I